MGFQEEWRDLPGAGEFENKLETSLSEETRSMWLILTELPPPSPSLSNICWPNSGKAKPSNERKS